MIFLIIPMEDRLFKKGRPKQLPMHAPVLANSWPLATANLLITLGVSEKSSKIAKSFLLLSNTILEQKLSFYLIPNFYHYIQNQNIPIPKSWH